MKDLTLARALRLLLASASDQAEFDQFHQDVVSLTREEDGSLNKCLRHLKAKGIELNSDFLDRDLTDWNRTDIALSIRPKMDILLTCLGDSKSERYPQFNHVPLPILHFVPLVPPIEALDEEK